MKNTELHFISRLSDYTLRSIFTRIALVSGTGALFLYMAVRVTGDAAIDVTVFEYAYTILIFNLVTEGNVFFDHLAEKYLPIPEKISLRLVIHVLISLFLGSLLLIFFILIGEPEVWFIHPMMQLMILFGLIFIFILILMSVTVRIIEKWVYSVKQLEELKNLKLASDYSSLQSQLNPHFLFNNLSVLKSMIKYAPEVAVKFTQDFTDVYRYVLECRDKVKVKLSDELVFLEAYTSLHKERMGAALKVDIRVDEKAKKMEIPPLALQQLVENAIKHNIALKNSPLIIKVEADSGRIRVSNNLNPKDSGYSEKSGLNNLVKRYSLLTSKPVIINPGENFFEVEIPLL